MRISTLLLAGSLALSAACGSGEATVGSVASVGGAIAITTQLDDAQKTAAEALKGTLEGNAFPYAEKKKPENAVLYLALAAAEPTNDALVAACLDGMAETWTHADQVKDKRLVDDDYKLVVRSFLDSANDVVKARAIHAARYSVMAKPADAETVAKLVEIGTSGTPAARYAVLDEMWNMNEWQKDEKVASMYLEGTKAKEAWLVSAALFRVKHNSYGIAKEAEFRTQMEGLLKHEDAGVRGRAVSVLAAIARDDGQKTKAGDLIEPMLADGHPYVRSEAATAIGTLKRTSAVPAMMKLLDDKEKNTHDISGWTQLDGTAGSVHHDGSAWSRVDDAVLQALKSMTYSMGDKKFDPPKIDYKTVDADIAKGVADAKAWHTKHGASL